MNLEDRLVVWLELSGLIDHFIVQVAMVPLSPLAITSEGGRRPQD